MTNQKLTTKQIVKDPVVIGILATYALCIGMCTYSTALYLNKKPQLIQQADIKLQGKKTQIRENY